MLIHALLLTLGITNQSSMLKEKNSKSNHQIPRFLLDPCKVIPGSQENLVEEEEALLRETLSPGAVVESMAY